MTFEQIIEAMDEYLDDIPWARANPEAQDWARVAKASEEVGEAIDALIGVTGQNPRKGNYGSMDDLLSELADVALTGMYAIQHFTKDRRETADVVRKRAEHHARRVGLLFDEA